MQAEHADNLSQWREDKERKSSFLSLFLNFPFPPLYAGRTRIQPRAVACENLAGQNGAGGLLSWFLYFLGKQLKAAVCERVCP